MSKQAVIEVRKTKREKEYFVKGLDVTESVELLLEEIKKDYEFKKGCEIIAVTQQATDIVNGIEKKLKNKIADLQDQLAQCKQDAELIAKSNSGLANMVTKKDHQIAILEKALEMACEKLPMEYEYCPSHPERYNLQDEYGSDEPYWVEEGGCEFDSPENCLECVIKHFKNKAEERMKSE